MGTTNWLDDEEQRAWRGFLDVHAQLNAVINRQLQSTTGLSLSDYAILVELTSVSDVRVVVLRMPQLQVLDATGAQALGELIEDLEARHVTVLLKGPRAEHLRVLRAVGALEHLRHERHLFEDLDAAIAHARLHATRPPQPHEPSVTGGGMPQPAASGG